MTRAAIRHIKERIELIITILGLWASGSLIAYVIASTDLMHHHGM